MPSPAQKTSKRDHSSTKSSPPSGKSPAETSRDDESSTPAMDAIALLKADHKQVAEWFDKFESARSDEVKQALAQQICAALRVHAEIEEEIFYPAFLDATGEKDLHHEAAVEHAGAKNLIAQIEGSGPDEEYFDAKVTVLGELIRHHVNEEEKRDGMFAKAKRSTMDLEALGEQLQARKDELTDEAPPQRRAG